jgi:hypothetical protein
MFFALRYDVEYLNLLVNKWLLLNLLIEKNEFATVCRGRAARRTRSPTSPSRVTSADNSDQAFNKPDPSRNYVFSPTLLHVPVQLLAPTAPPLRTPTNRLVPASAAHQ